MAGDPQILEIELAKLKVLVNDIQAHQTSVDTLNDAGRQIIESGEGEFFILCIKGKYICNFPKNILLNNKHPKSPLHSDQFYDILCSPLSAVILFFL